MEDKYLTKLFYSMWRNLVIKNQILYHLKMVTIHYHKRIIMDTKHFTTNVNAEYLRYVVLYFGGNNYKLLEMLNHLPSNVKIVEFGTELFEEPIDVAKSIPSTITTLKFNKSNKSIPNSIPINGNLKSLVLGTPDIKSKQLLELLNGNQSLTFLDIGKNSNEFESSSPSQKLPTNLKIFKCSWSSFNFTSDLFLNPNNITELDFSGCNKLEFKKVSLSLFGNLKSINFGQNYTDPIKEGFLPNGLQILKLPNNYDVSSNLTNKSIPNSVTILKFSVFDCHESGVWEKKLFGIDEIPITTSKLPLSLIKLELGLCHFLKNDMTMNDHLSNLKKITFSNNFLSYIPLNVCKLKYVNGATSSYGGAQKIEINLPKTSNVTSLSLYGNVEVNPIIDIDNNKNQTIIKEFKTGGKNKLVGLSNSKISSLTLGYDETGVPPKVVESYDTIDESSGLLALSIYECCKGTTVFPKSLTLLELNVVFSYSIDTSLLPSSIHTLIIRGASNIQLPLSPNIKSIYISSFNGQFLTNLDFKKNCDLLEIIKVIDDKNDIFKKLSRQLIK